MLRILRVLEYEYEDQQTLEDDMARWVCPPGGHIVRGKIRIASTILMPRLVTGVKED